MIKETLISTIVDEFCKEKDFFLVSVNVRQGNRILILLDGEKGVSIDDCVQLSRFVNSKLDRETEDFELEVSSFGVGNPLMLPKQYKINIGRMAKVTLNDNTTISGKIVNVGEYTFSLEVKIPPKKKEVQQKEINFSDCLKTQILISF